MAPLRSQLFAGDALLQSIADSEPRSGPRLSSTQNRTAPAVGKVQRALLDWRPDCLPRFGADGKYGSETATAVKRFKTEQFGLQSPTGDVGPGTTNRLDEMQLARQGTTPPPTPPTPPTPPAGPRVRRDIQSLLAGGPSGRAVIDAYARGIAAMRLLDADPAVMPANPRSWRFQAAIHGIDGVPDSVNHPLLFGSCRHESWFFLAWHRLYLLHFESIVQSHIGDPTWSLPYWDYTKSADPQLLPEPFRVPTTNNPLFTTERDPRINAGTEGLGSRVTDAGPALANPRFSSLGAAPNSTFGGASFTDAVPNHNARGMLENIPHGAVHVGVGGATGWMSRFETAALDPIFWLHHCNIDRLWDVWLGIHGPAALPTDRAWLDTRFPFFDARGARDDSRTIRDILITPALGYTYESTSPPPPRPRIASTGALPGGMAFADTALGALMPPELLGATTGIDMSGVNQVDIALGAPAGTELPTEALAKLTDTPEATPRLTLHIEDIVGAAPAAPVYEVYLNLPAGAHPDAHPERLIGAISSFGVREASSRESAHGGVGITDAFEITEVVRSLADAQAWNPASVSVAIVPRDITGDVIPGGDIRAGRISVHVG